MDTLNLFSVQDFFVVMCRLKDITGTLNNQIISLFSFTLTKNIQSKQALKNILKRKGKDYFFFLKTVCWSPVVVQLHQKNVCNMQRCTNIRGNA